MGKDNSEILIHPPNPLPLKKEGGIFIKGIWLIGIIFNRRPVAVIIEQDAASLCPGGGKGGYYIPPGPAR